MAKSKTGAGVGVGGSSILVIFILLCLTTFATLSMVSANADLRLTEKAATAVKEYYAADAAAEEVLAAIAAAPTKAHDILGELQAWNIEAGDQAALIVTYSIPVNEAQELAVAVRLNADGSLERRQWQVVSIGEWEPESGGFNLWEGDEGDGVMLGLPTLG